MATLIICHPSVGKGLRFLRLNFIAVPLSDLSDLVNWNSSSQVDFKFGDIPLREVESFEYHIRDMNTWTASDTRSFLQSLEKYLTANKLGGCFYLVPKFEFWPGTQLNGWLAEYHKIFYMKTPRIIP